MCVTVKKLQRNGLCAVPVILDYTADKTTATVSFPRTLKDLAWVVAKLLEQPDMLSPSQEAHTSPATLWVLGGRNIQHHLGLMLLRPRTPSPCYRPGAHSSFTSKCHPGSLKMPLIGGRGYHKEKFGKIRSGRAEKEEQLER